MISSTEPVPTRSNSVMKPGTSSKTRLWFRNHLLKPRLLAAYIWGTSLVPLCGGLALVFLGAQFFTVFSPSLYRLLFWTACSVSLIAYLTLHGASVVPRVSVNRLAIVLTLLRPSLFGSFAFQALLGAIVTLSVVGVGDPSFDALVMEPVGQSSATLHEGAAFVSAAGAFATALAALKDVVGNKNILTFPTIRFVKTLRIRKALPILAFISAKEGFFILKWFGLVYFFLGGFYKNFLCTALMSEPVCPKSGHIAMDSLWAIMELGVLWKTFVAVVFVLFARRVVIDVVVAFVVEPASFPIHSVLEESSNQPTLEEALRADDAPLAQYLAYEHLLELAQGNEKSRKPFFLLSQPGGHPHVWNNVLEACTLHLRGLLENVSACNASLAMNNNNNAGAGKPDRGVSSLFLTRHSPFRYLLREFPGARARKVFVECRKSAWALESLAHLVSASFAEDEFGVVQKKLAPLLELFVSLHDAVEKNVKLFPVVGEGTVSGGKFASSSFVDGAAATLRSSVRSALKSSIYRIVATFGSHLYGVQGLNADTSKRLKSFIEMKE